MEACYPFCERSRALDAACHGAAALAGALIVSARATSTAYVPLPLSAALAGPDERGRRAMTGALGVAVGVPFAAAVGVNYWAWRCRRVARAARRARPAP